MNSAPAELLHHLIHAALQPHSATPLFLSLATARRSWWRRSMCRAACSTGATTAVTKKNAGHKAGVGILFQKNQQVFQRKCHLSRPSRDQRQNHRRSIASSTVHQCWLQPLRFAVLFLVGLSPTRVTGFRLQFVSPPISRSSKKPYCLVIPSSVRHPSGIRLRVSRRSCVPSSDRSSRSSTGRDSLPVGTSDRVRSAARAGLR